MEALSTAVLLGLVEGLTEFLPVSSTGHLILAGEALGFSGPKAATFEIAIQFGAILAVLCLYRERFLGLLRPAPEKNPRAFAGLRGIWLLLLTTLPGAVMGLLAGDFIKNHLFTPASVASALLAGALLMLLVEWRNACSLRTSRCNSLDELTPVLALGIGCCQCMALWPGFSRSASTIMGGMLLGMRRETAAEYSFLAAVPLITLFRRRFSFRLSFRHDCHKGIYHSARKNYPPPLCHLSYFSCNSGILVYASLISQKNACHMDHFQL